MVCLPNSPCQNGVPGEAGNDWQMLKGGQGERGATGMRGATGAVGEKGKRVIQVAMEEVVSQGSYRSDYSYLEGDIVEWKQDMWILRCVDGLACDVSTAPDVAGNDWHNLRGFKVTRELVGQQVQMAPQERQV